MKTIYTHKPESNQLVAKRSFTAPKSKVWQYYTTAEFLDTWWGPKPYDAVTESMNFTDGGEWHYVMRGPEGDAHYCINRYSNINPEDSFSATDAFANEDWSVKTDMPSTEWEVSFVENDGVTTVTVVLTSKTEADMNTLVEMGMKEGFDMGLNQLEVLLEGA
jgi:uncharacterized protein YndB with AHSA1/START domain